MSQVLSILMVRLGRKQWAVKLGEKFSRKVKFSEAIKIRFMVEDLYKEQAKTRKPHKWMRKLND